MLRRQQQEIHAKKGMARRCAADEGEKENKVVMEERPPEAIAVVKTKKRSKKPQQSQQPSNVELEHILQGACSFVAKLIRFSFASSHSDFLPSLESPLRYNSQEFPLLNQQKSYTNH